MKSGQTTSYRTGDDGNLQYGRPTNFLTLLENNIFGNTNRFTDILGGSTYASNIVLDHSTACEKTKVILAWYRVQSSGNIQWAAAIDAALALSVLTFTTGWHLPNINQLLSLVQYGNGIFNYEPINLADGGQSLWTSTSQGAANAYRVLASTGGSAPLAKTSSSGYRWIACRYFTFSELGH